MNKFILLLFICISFISCGEFVPTNYSETVMTGGDIEAHYLKMGKHEVSFYEQSVTDKKIKSIVVFYPNNIKTLNHKLPAVIFANGSGVTASKYRTLFQHLASWGFIVIGNEAESSGNGDSTDSTIEFIIKEDKSRQSPLFNKVDMSNIGISGHSQGGAGVFNAITDNNYGKYYKTAVALSPTNEETAAGMKWAYSPELVNIPTLMFAGTEGDFETKIVIPLDRMKQIYAKLKGMRVMARKKNCEHGQMLYSADGYVTAWFMWQLKGDKSAAKAFVGEFPELQGNNLYQNISIDIK